MTTPLSRRTFIQASAIALGSALVARPEEQPTGGNVPVCPKSAPPARTLYAFRLKSITSREWDIALSLSCLQGIVNRLQPRLYLIHDHYDELWLEWLRKRGDIDDVQWLGIAEVFERFLPAGRQMYVTDPAVPANVNVATMLAAVRGGALRPVSQTSSNCRAVTLRTRAAWDWTCARLAGRRMLKRTGGFDSACHVLQESLRNPVERVGNPYKS